MSHILPITNVSNYARRALRSVGAARFIASMRAITVYAPKPAGIVRTFAALRPPSWPETRLFRRHLPTLRGNLQGMRYECENTRTIIAKNVQRFAESALMYASAWPLERSSGESTMCTL